MHYCRSIRLSNCLFFLSQASCSWGLAPISRIARIGFNIKLYCPNEETFNVDRGCQMAVNSDANAEYKREESWGGTNGEGLSFRSTPRNSRKRNVRDDQSKHIKSLDEKRNGNFVASASKEQIEDSTYIQFSRVFQRHVVYSKKAFVRTSDQLSNNQLSSCAKVEVIESFEFLDEAMERYPTVQVVTPKDITLSRPNNDMSLSHFIINNNNYQITDRNLTKSNNEENEFEFTIAGMGLIEGFCELDDQNDSLFSVTHDSAQSAIRTLLSLISTSEDSCNEPRHFFRLNPCRIASRGLTSDIIKTNYARVIELLRSNLAMNSSDIKFVMSNFPFLCLYNSDELESLISFILSPFPPESLLFSSVYMIAEKGIDGGSIDWPWVASKGYGAGLTVHQATKAVRMMPELLSLYYEDSSKPSTIYVHYEMQESVSSTLMNEVNNHLGLFLEGTPPSDRYTFAYLRSIGVSWMQLRVLISALPLWTNCNLEPSWDIAERGPVRSKLKRQALDYLRQRLQVRPSNIYRMIKTHTRLSGYDAFSKIKPILNKLQSSLNLTSAQTRKLVLRMPSLMGISTHSIDDKLDFFRLDANMSTQMIKDSLLKHPSLIHYSTSATLRPKLNFFRNELGLTSTSVSKLISTAPALMGFSLTDNLRPKVASIMRLCALNQYEVGIIVATSPSLLLLSQKGKIEPTLSFLSSMLFINSPKDLGKLLMTAPRVLNHSLSSIEQKFLLLTKSLRSEKRAVAVLLKNSALLVASYDSLTSRIEKCINTGKDISLSLHPSRKGRKRLVHHAPPSNYGTTIIVSTDSSFESLSRISPSIMSAAQEFGVTESAIHQALRKGDCIDGKYFSELMTSPEETFEIRTSDPTFTTIESNQRLCISIYVAGGTYPKENDTVARGFTRTGGVAINVSADGSTFETSKFYTNFHVAAASCLGITVPRGEHDVNTLLSVFPLMNPSRNRCDLFSCATALRIMENYLSAIRKDGDVTQCDIKIYTESNYVMKLVGNRNRLLQLGALLTCSEELLSKLKMKRSYVNVDILHPLARSFHRLNGTDERNYSPNEKINNVRVDFRHSMSDFSLHHDFKNLFSQARSAAKWQYDRQ